MTTSSIEPPVETWQKATVRQNLRTSRWTGTSKILGCAIALWATPSLATDVFVYDVPAACPSRAEFLHHVGEKLREPKPERVEQRLSDLVSALQVSGDGTRGTLKYGGPGQERSERVLTAETCLELITSVALICAIALDSEQPREPSAPVAPSELLPGAPSPATRETPAKELSPTTPESSTPLRPATESPATEQNPSRSERAMPQGPAAEQLAAESEPASQQQDPEEPTAEPAKPTTAPPQQDRSTPDASDAALQWSTGLGARWDGWSGPGKPWGLDLFVRAKPASEDWALRTAVMHTRSDSRVTGREATFRSLLAGLEGCLTLWRTGPGWALEGCPRISLGVLDASGVQDSTLVRAERARIFWLDGAAVMRAMTPLWGRVRFELQGEVGSALREHRFEFDEPSAMVFHARPRPALGGRVGFSWDW